ncbi:MAG: hypothetical protein AB9922_05300 [Bacteroidales bacterium]
MNHNRLFNNIFQTIIIGTLVIISACSCTKNILPAGDQQGSLIISQSVFSNEAPDNYSIKNASISGDSLIVEVTSGGCSGKSWVLKVVDSGAVAESYPVQRFVKIFLENNETCKALITRKFTIDITPLKVVGEDRIAINLERWRGVLFYPPQL